MATLSRGGGIAPELTESLSANPLNDNSWQEIAFSNKYNKILYDNVNDIYYGIIQSLSNSSYSTTIYIYRIDSVGETLIGQHTYQYTYSAFSNITTRYIDSIYSVYKEKILILVSYYFEPGYEDTGSYSTDWYRFCLHEFDTNSHQFTDIDEFVHLDQFNNSYSNSIYFQGCDVEVGDYDNSVFTSYYHPSNMYIANNWLFFLCNDPKYSIFKLNLQNTSYNNSTVNDIDYDIYGEIGNDSSGNYIGTFAHYLADWENFLDEMYRPGTTITDTVTMSIAESKNYVVFGIVSTVTDGSGDPDYWESYTNNYLHCIVFDKIDGIATSSANTHRLEYNNLTAHGTAISCYDYDNDKFILSNLYDNQSRRIFDINVVGNLEDTFNAYSTSQSNILYIIINLKGKYYTLYLFNSDIYIREGVDLATIHNQNTYTLLK